ncbi:hypothetical protein X941_4728 [Burkholderia pseudomallei MSHR5569]|nr:hypothetical protein X941_4728 [Burkholderia pseudomallei MSHR5569]
MWSCNQDWLKRFFAMRWRDCCRLLREAALLADNTGLIGAAFGPEGPKPRFYVVSARRRGKASSLVPARAPSI